MRTRTVHVAVVGLLTLTLTGCGGADTSAGSSAGGSTSAGPTSAKPGSPTPSSPGPSSGSPSAATTSVTPTSAHPSPTVRACTTADLSVSVGNPEGAAGSTFYRLRLRNVSDLPCRTGGFGGVSLVSTPRGAPIGAPADRTQRGRAKPLVLVPNGHADATLQITQAENFSRAECRPVPARGLRVYPPDQTVSRFVRLQATACRSAATHLLSLTPYQRTG